MQESDSMSNENPQQWTVEEVGQWLEAQGLGHCRHEFAEREVDGKALLVFKEEDVVAILVSVRDLKVVGRGNTTTDSDTEAAPSQAGEHQEADSHHAGTTTSLLLGLLGDAKRLNEAIDGLRRCPSSGETVDMNTVASPPPTTDDTDDDDNTGVGQASSDNQ